MRNEKRVSEDLFTEIYSEYSGKIHNLAYRMTGSEDVSDDIAQETFIQVYRNLHKFRGESAIFTWIYAIAKNISLRHLQKNRRQSFLSLENLIKKASRTSSCEKYTEPEKQYYISQVKDGCLLGVLRCLSFNQRMAFILNLLSDLPIDDVSKIISKSENSTRILVHRARKKIRDFLCSNCSLYNERNKCRCENLISFSLEKGWIKKYSPGVDPEIIESEIKAFNNEIILYKTVTSKKRSDDLKKRIFSIIKERKFNIFSGKKVK